MGQHGPMTYSLVVNCSPHEIRVALLEDGQISEFFLERRKDASLVGNVYKGRVTRVLPGMQAAFVEVGLERAAFLYVADVTQGRRADDSTSTMSEARQDGFHPPIQSLLHEGLVFMVQVAKEPLGTKGARVTSHVSIAGRHLVLMPTVEHVGVSRRIGDDEERRRLKEILETLVPTGIGIVARTAAEGRSGEELGADLEFLRQVWNDILGRSESGGAPVTLYEDLDLLLRSARDLVTPELESIYIDDPVEYQRLKTFMTRFVPRYADRVKPFEASEPIFEHFGIEAELNRALANKVWLPSGGYLIIDQTEALTAIDVNTGRFVGKRNLADTILKTNVEAIEEVVRQLRLRNIGGIIVIDFIDMEAKANRSRVYSELSEALKKDRARTNILKISELGLVEMTRKRVRESLIRSVSETCFYCGGTGLLKSRSTIAHEIYRHLVREADQIKTEVVHIAVHPRVAETLREEEQSMMEELSVRLGKALTIEVREDFHLEHFEFSAVDQSGRLMGRKFTGRDGLHGP